MTKVLYIFQINNHPESYSCLENLAELYFQKFLNAMHTGDKKQAKKFKQQSVDCFKRALEILNLNFPANPFHVKRIEAKLKNS